MEEPGQFDRFSRKNCYKRHDGKCIDFIFGVKNNKSKVQAFRFDKQVWTAAAARSYCKNKGGRFEAASG
jgi:hypothetical protein